MSYEADGVQVGTDPVPVCTIGPSGVIVQVLSGGPVWFGGEDVEPGKGLLLAQLAGWQTLPGGNAVSSGIGQPPVPLTLYGVTESGEARVGYLRHMLPTS